MDIGRTFDVPRAQRSNAPRSGYSTADSAPATRVIMIMIVTVHDEPRRSATCLQGGEAAQLSAR
jgi:hypothetical protein